MEGARRWFTIKRYGKLWPEIVSRVNLELVLHLAVQNKTTKPVVRRFELHTEENLLRIQQMLIDGWFHTAPYSEKRIFEPKERLIYILPFDPDRIVQHAVMNIVERIWNPMFNDHSYSCRTGFGLHAGMQYTMSLVVKNRYCAKNDISKFYPSMLHSVAMEFIERKIKDHKVLDFFEDLVYSIKGERNIPIGNYTSQWIGNLYLDEMDHFIKETLHIRDYVRYCDDFLLFHNDKKYLNYCESAIEEYLATRLGMKFSKNDVFPVERGVDFLGYRMFPERYILVRTSTAKRIKKRAKYLMEQLNEGSLVFDDHVKGMIFSTLGWMKYANTHNLSMAYDWYTLEKEARSAIAVQKKERKEAKWAEIDKFNSDFAEYHARELSIFNKMIRKSGD